MSPLSYRGYLCECTPIHMEIWLKEMVWPEWRLNKVIGIQGWHILTHPLLLRLDFPNLLGNQVFVLLRLFRPWQCFKGFWLKCYGGKTVKLKFTVERKNRCKGEETKDEFTSAILTNLQYLNMIWDHEDVEFNQDPWTPWVQVTQLQYLIGFPRRDQQAR